jgi:hypothetical protein
MEAPVTLVSCLFWLARTKWQHSGFPPNYDRYASWSENFLSLDASIVIFTDDHYYNSVLEKRKKYDPDLTKTRIIVKKIEELDFYKKYFFRMSVLMSSPQFKNIKHGDCADNMYPLYNVVQYNKISLVREVRDLNPFGSTHFMWMDCGSCREDLQKYNNKKFPLNFEFINSRVIHFTHNYDFNIDTKQSYFLSQIRNIQGTSWILPTQHVDKYYELISHELETTMADGFIGSDEKTYDSIYLQNKEIIQLVKCNWFQFFDVMSVDRGDNKVPYCSPVPQSQPETNELDVNCQLQPEKTVDNCQLHEEQVASTEPDNNSVSQHYDPSCITETCHNNVVNFTPADDTCVELDGSSTVAMQPPKKSWWQRLIGI